MKDCPVCGINLQERDAYVDLECNQCGSNLEVHKVIGEIEHRLYQVNQEIPVNERMNKEMTEAMIDEMNIKQRNYKLFALTPFKLRILILSFSLLMICTIVSLFYFLFSFQGNLYSKLQQQEESQLKLKDEIVKNTEKLLQHNSTAISEAVTSINALKQTIAEQQELIILLSSKIVNLEEVNKQRVLKANILTKRGKKK